MATLNVGIKISNIAIVNGSVIANTFGVDYVIPANEYGEAELLGFTSLGPSTTSYIWAGLSDTNGKARAFGCPNTTNVIEIGNVVSNSIVPCSQLAGATKVYLSALSAVGWRVAIFSPACSYAWSIRTFRNTI